MCPAVGKSGAGRGLTTWGHEDLLSNVKCYIKCSYYNGWLNAFKASIKFASVLLGNVPGVRLSKDTHFAMHGSIQVKTCLPFGSQNAETVYVVQIRAGLMRKLYPLFLPEGRTKAAFGETELSSSGYTFQFLHNKGLTASASTRKR